MRSTWFFFFFCSFATLIGWLESWCILVGCVTSQIMPQGWASFQSRVWPKTKWSLKKNWKKRHLRPAKPLGVFLLVLRLVLHDKRTEFFDPMPWISFADSMTHLPYGVKGKTARRVRQTYSYRAFRRQVGSRRLGCLGARNKKKKKKEGLTQMLHARHLPVAQKVESRMWVKCAASEPGFSSFFPSAFLFSFLFFP